MSEWKVVLVTGASSGIGQAIAFLLAQKGFCVYGTSRNPLGMEPLPGVEVLPLDVCSDESAYRCLDTVSKRAGRLDILINNAAYGQNGAVEEVSLEEAKTQFETNLYGVMRMVKGALPCMRQQGGGQIINISSMAALLPLPFGGIYSASKAALEAYTEALRHEVKPFNINVSLVEPGFVKTNFTRNTQSPTTRVRDYDPWRERFQEAVRQREEQAPAPSLVAECVLSIIQDHSPKLRYLVGKAASRMSLLRRFVPESLFEQQTRKAFHLDAEQ